MTTTDTLLYGGTRWDERGRWWYELIRNDGTTERVPGLERRLAFRVRDTARYCLGYYGFGSFPGRRACPESAQVTSGRQCADCRVQEGWTAVHAHRGPISALPEQIRDYVSQPHHLYIAYFGDGLAKVGTASAVRRHRRLYEQGALAARFVADSPDGLHVRELERVVSAQAGFRQAVGSAAKTRILAKPLAPWAALEAAVAAAAADALAVLPAGTMRTDTAWSGGSEFYRTVAQRGRYATVVDFGGAALGEYVLDAVTAHGHTIACHNGSETGELLLVNDTQLVGRRIELDDSITAAPVAAQTSLF
ncbi:hypothetical protein [Nocardia niwae]|uniref:hypothetical protein n=1 Tax=Nocardia niwae TaxID=626084 RepID=UPI0033E25AA8